MNKNDVMLTTYNNPFDPFTKFEDWYRFDVSNGTDCCGYVSRMVDSLVSENKKLEKTNDAFVDDETNDSLIEEALNKIINMDSLTYLLVHPGDRRYTLSPEEFKKTIPEIVE